MYRVLILMEESLTLFHREIIAVIKKNVLYCIK